MARPQKSGIDYFTLDTNMEDKIKLIEAKYGLEGFGLLIKLWQKIYSQKYFIEWTEEIQLLFSSEVNVDINKINDIINDCVKWNVFNPKLFKKYRVLTSHGIQLRYKEATYRRKKVEMKEDYLLLKGDEINSNMVNENNNPINDDNNSKNDNKSTQSKVKESKVKESKGKESKEKEKENGRDFEIFFDENVDKFQDHIQQMSKAVVLNACKISIEKNNPLAYCRVVLKDWNQRGIENIDDLKTAVKNKDSPESDCNYKWKDFFIDDWDRFKE